MSTNFIHHEIERIRAKRSNLMKRMDCMVEGSPIHDDLNEQCFDLFWQQGALEEQAERERVRGGQS
jgi:hypothetical protein